MADLLSVHPEIRRRVEAMVAGMRRSGFSATITSGYRSIDQQRKLYAARQAGQHPYPVAPPGCSEHNYGLAVDLVTTAPQEQLHLWGQFYGLRWAGPVDVVHWGVFTPAEWKAIHEGAGIRC